jgi:hypothetical protein
LPLLTGPAWQAANRPNFLNAVYDALNDETSSGYAQVRVARPAAA